MKTIAFWLVLCGCASAFPSPVPTPIPSNVAVDVFTHQNPPGFYNPTSDTLFVVSQDGRRIGSYYIFRDGSYTYFVTYGKVTSGGVTYENFLLNPIPRATSRDDAIREILEANK